MGANECEVGERSWNAGYRAGLAKALLEAETERLLWPGGEGYRAALNGAIKRIRSLTHPEGAGE